MHWVGKSGVLIFSSVMILFLVSFEANARGAQETAVRDVSGFDSVAFNMSGELLIAQGEQEALEISARAQDLPNIVTEVRDQKLFIGWEGAKPAFSFRSPRFRLIMKTVAGLETHSSGNIVADNLRLDSLRIRTSSSGDISIRSLAAGSLEVQITSSGSVRATGKAVRQDILLSSSGSYLAGNLASTTARVRASSSGSATVRVSDSLEANVTSSGDVRYYGSPQRVDGKVTSSGRLFRLGN